MGEKTNSSSLQDWLGKFRNRRGGVSLRKVESRSLTRTTVFNPHNLKLFFNNLKTFYIRPEVSLQMICNLYETGVNTADIFYVDLISMYCNIAQTFVPEVENLKICKVLFRFCGVFTQVFIKIVSLSS